MLLVYIALSATLANGALAPPQAAPEEPTPPSVSPLVVSATAQVDNVSVSAIKTDSVLVTWDSTSPGTSTIEYGPTTAYGTLSPQDSLAYFHVQTLNGLTAGTTYHYRIRSKDHNGVETVSPDSTFTTRTPPQLEAVIRAARQDAGLPKTYYVSPSGDDSRDGLSIATAWRSPTTAVSRVDVGDTVYILDGTWPTEQLEVTRSGIDVAPIRVAAYDSPTNGMPEVNAFNAAGSNIHIHGLKAVDGGTSGSHNVVSNCDVNNAFTSSASSLGFNILENCDVHDADNNGVQVMGANPNTGPSCGPVTNDPPVTHITIRNNRVHRTPYHGLVDMFGDLQYVTIQGNELFDTPWPTVFTHDCPNHVEYLAIRDNNMHDATSEGVYVSRVTELLIDNNTFTNYQGNYPVDLFFSITNAILRGNTFHGSLSPRLNGVTNGLFFKNRIASDSNSYMITYGSDAIVRDPLGQLPIVLCFSGRASCEYSDGTVFATDYPAGAPAVTYYPDRSASSPVTSPAGECATLNQTPYAMTARPAAGTATVTVNYFDTTLPAGILVDFTASASGSSVTFGISTLKPLTGYEIKKDGAHLASAQTGDTGKLTFSDALAAAHTYTVEESGGVPSDLIFKDGFDGGPLPRP